MVHHLKVLQLAIFAVFPLEYVVAANDKLQVEDMGAGVGILMPSASQQLPLEACVAFADEDFGALVEVVPLPIACPLLGEYRTNAYLGRVFSGASGRRITVDCEASQPLGEWRVRREPLLVHWHALLLRAIW